MKDGSLREMEYFELSEALEYIEMAVTKYTNIGVSGVFINIVEKTY